MTARLTPQILVAVLRRLAEAEGGAAVVAQRGHDQAGGLLVVLTERGQSVRTAERRTGWDGELTWDVQLVENESAENRHFFDAMLQCRKESDADLWLLELDIPDAERFVAQMDALG